MTLFANYVFATRAVERIINNMEGDANKYRINVNNCLAEYGKHEKLISSKINDYLVDNPEFFKRAKSLFSKLVVDKDEDSVFAAIEKIYKPLLELSIEFHARVLIEEVPFMIFWFNQIKELKENSYANYKTYENYLEEAKEHLSKILESI